MKAMGGERRKWNNDGGIGRVILLLLAIIVGVILLPICIFTSAAFCWVVFVLDAILVVVLLVKRG